MDREGGGEGTKEMVITLMLLRYGYTIIHNLKYFDFIRAQQYNFNNNKTHK
jgi:hypothetical protein